MDGPAATFADFATIIAAVQVRRSWCPAMLARTARAAWVRLARTCGILLPMWTQQKTRHDSSSLWPRTNPSDSRAHDQDDRTLHVVYAADATYLPYCLLSAHSISSGLGADRVQFSLLTPDAGFAQSMLAGGAGVEFTVLEPEFEWALGHTSAAEVRHVSQATFLRLQIAELLPSDISRFLYLDCDVLCLDPPRLLELLRFDLAGAPLAAAIDQFTPTAGSRGGLPGLAEHPTLTENSPNFNAGVLLVDRAEWLRVRVRERVETYLRTYNDRLRFHDQDGLNFALAGELAELPPAFNYVLDRDEATRLPQGTDVCLVHSTGPVKHWSPEYPDGLVKDRTNMEVAALQAVGAWHV